MQNDKDDINSSYVFYVYKCYYYFYINNKYVS